MFLQNKRLFSYGISISFLILAIFLGVSIGSLSIPFSTIINIFLNDVFHMNLAAVGEPMYHNIVMEIRFPRVFLAGLVGASLAISGAAFQGLLKNPLADPYTLGVSSGASVGAVCVIFFGIAIPAFGSFTLPLFSISFGFITIVVVLLFARMVQRTMSVETIILTGIIFSSFLGSLISLMIALTGEELRQIITWLLGSVSMRGWDYVKMIIPFFIIGTILLLINGHELNALSFGEERAQHLGVNVQRRKFLIMIAASILTGAAVAVSGTIGFVGLVIPHLTRLLYGTDHKHLLPLSMINGGSFLILADLAARTIIAPTQLPIGVLTALIGAPVFAVILFRQRIGRSG
jgi:iron complex transport system permease protein